MRSHLGRLRSVTAKDLGFGFFLPLSPAEISFIRSTMPWSANLAGFSMVMAISIQMALLALAGFFVLQSDRVFFPGWVFSEDIFTHFISYVQQDFNSKHNSLIIGPRLFLFA